jgi:hypothetical protein
MTLQPSGPHSARDETLRWLGHHAHGDIDSVPQKVLHASLQTLTVCRHKFLGRKQWVANRFSFSGSFEVDLSRLDAARDRPEER